MAKTRKKQETTPAVVKEEEKVVAQAAQESPEVPEEKAPEPEPEKKKSFSLKDLQGYEKKAKTLALKGDFKAIENLVEEPGLILKAFTDTVGNTRLRIRYEKDGEVLVNKIETLHKLK